MAAPQGEGDDLVTKLPKDEIEWNEEARKAKILNRSIHSLRDLKSGSKIDTKQYLMLRALWPKLQGPEKLDLTRAGLQNEYAEARTFLNNFTPFQNFLDGIRNASSIEPYDPNDPLDMGIFTIPRAEQLEIPHTANTKTSSQISVDGNNEQIAEEGHTVAKTIDEDTVNSSLMSYLRALTLKAPWKRNQWSSHRLSLKARFRTSKYEARVDGYLKSKATGKAKALVEVKAGSRTKHLPQVQMQETAEMAAWLQNSEETDFSFRSTSRKLMLSQDGREVYLVLPEYGEGYLRYLKDEGPMRPNFLTMHQYGPYRTDDHLDVEELSTVLLAHIIREDRLAQH